MPGLANGRGMIRPGGKLSRMLHQFVRTQPTILALCTLKYSMVYSLGSEVVKKDVESKVPISYEVY